MKHLLLVLLLCSVAAFTFAQDEQVEGKIKTIYGPDGRPINQSETAKGWHQVAGTVKLSYGWGSVTLNTSTVDQKQDVSFLDSTSYRGLAWSLDTNNTNTYTVIPRSGTRFVVRSSVRSDTATINYRVEGE